MAAEPTSCFWLIPVNALNHIGLCRSYGAWLHPGDRVAINMALLTELPCPAALGSAEKVPLSPWEVGTSVREVGTSFKEVGTSLKEVPPSAREVGTSKAEGTTSEREGGTSPAELTRKGRSTPSVSRGRHPPPPQECNPGTTAASRWLRSRWPFWQSR